MNNELWDECVKFHGHICPGLTIGYKAAMLARKLFDGKSANDEEIVCITENDACGVDGIQVVLGCTFGKGNLIYKDHGKVAYSFYSRDSKKEFRLVFRRDIGGPTKRDEKQKFLLNSAEEDLFEIKEVKQPLPQKAKLFNTVICELCKEGAAEHRIRLFDGKKACVDCFEEYTRVY
ncbi:FmdE family protein [Proteinivorax hydrogeniformans]|uniref:FmdE family protein n=1 Tax=Proteinivorax hydrogeniformans TaxID=1826727 RepID=A0AAU8HW68_9FIRM